MSPENPDAQTLAILEAANHLDLWLDHERPSIL
ncbi:hypothetical protein PIIN_11030 [Serendipita indica DSM 11827]|uniref:Uncharacterized protein n=1 Tax=Serendipita indica (strain DSM 11827) TaxID=1109443 RepID=G4U0F2_SERID|nr:hypothetical protein PIIN_11030 [Serendipita indica DSM 11827]